MTNIQVGDTVSLIRDYEDANRGYTFVVGEVRSRGKSTEILYDRDRPSWGIYSYRVDVVTPERYVTYVYAADILPGDKILSVGTHAKVLYRVERDKPKPVTEFERGVAHAVAVHAQLARFNEFPTHAEFLTAFKEVDQ